MLLLLNRIVTGGIFLSSISRSRLEGLDVLRGFAAISIILFHVLFVCGFADKTSLTPIVAKLDIGVRFFYALSAFSLLYGYNKKIQMEDGLKKFYIGRFFRIAPLFYLCISFYLIAMPLWYDTKIEVADLLANLTFSFGLIPGKHESIVWAGWSIGVEWIFYFLFPLFVVLGRTIKSTLILLIISILIFYQFDILGLELQKISNAAYELNFLHQLMFFAAGLLSFKLYELIDFNKKIFRISFPIIIIPSLYLYFFTNLVVNPLADVLIAFIFIIIILYFATFPPKLLTNRLFITLGLCSFGLYLLHFIVIIFFLKTDILNKLNLLPQHGSSAFLTYFAFVFLMTFVLSYISYKFYEYPIMKLGKKLRISNQH